MDGGHVVFGVFATFEEGADVVGLVGAWIAADVADALVSGENSSGPVAGLASSAYRVGSVRGPVAHVTVR